ncbi:hypothetical protein Patl1_20721 [Pistacia atlantica]|uniref:Uncharacterized protein n=1 Tax=Pistacia atlantica TaxID=434234 RepID=A0ACC1BM52_9ROSI|nr:hypothetical protein Patl1_20721 [Pistacia atlantica]
MPAFSPRPIKIAITKSCSLPSIITLLKTSKLRTHLHQVHSHLIKKGLQQDHSLISHFISLCHSLGTSLSYSTSIFNQIITPSTFLWNTLLKGYSQRGCFIDILKYFIRMIREGGIPDKYTFPLVIKACSSELILRGGTAIHGAVIRLGLDDDVFVCTSLIDLYGKCKEIECARKVFDEMTNRNVVSWTAMVVGYVIVGDLAEGKQMFDLMPERNIVSWNALIGGLVKNGQPDEAVKIFYEMYFKDVKPDEFIMVSLMAACSQLGSLELAKWVDFYLSRSELDLSRGHVIASLIDMNAKCGNMDRAEELFEAMSNRDLISYCSMIQGLSIHGHGTQAVFLFNKMISEGLIPDEVAFTIILTACSHAGLVEEGLHYFESMQSVYSIVASPDHYACMVDLLSRTGHLKEAYELLNSMPVEPHEGAWGALLGACKLHCDVELGKLSCQKAF